MQPQPPTPSEAQPAADAQAAEASSEPIEEPSAPHWWQRLVPGRRPQVEPQDQPEAIQPSTITLTQEELDRRVQAETDRREAKRQQQAREDRKRQLRDEDPWAYAEEERKAESADKQNQQVGDLFANIGREHDKYSIDPIIETLPAAERTRILGLEGAGTGLDGRKLIVTEALKSLEKHWREEGAKDAESKLRRNQAFRKQLLAETRRGLAEPAVVIGTGASEGASEGSVSNLLRDQLRARH